MNVIPSTGITWGFTGQDVFSNTELIVASLASFILLGLAVKFAPSIIGIIKGVFDSEPAEIDEDFEEEED